MKKFLPILAVLCALAGQAGAQITKKGNAYLFRMKFTQGATTKYRVDSTISGLGPNGKGLQVKLPMLWKVLSIAKGVASIEATVGPVTVGSQTMMQPSTTTIKLDSLGRPVGDAGLPGQQITPAFPEKPVKVGATWKATMPIQGVGGQTSKVTATYKLNGIKTVNGHKVADLSVTTSGQATGSGTMQLLVSDGSLWHSSLKMKVNVKGQDGKPAGYTVTANISRV